MDATTSVNVDLWVAGIGLVGIIVQGIVGPAFTLWFSRKHGAKRKTLSVDVQAAVEAAIAKHVMPLVADVEKIKKRQKEDLKRRGIYVPDETVSGAPALTAEERAKALAFAEDVTPVDRNRK